MKQSLSILMIVTMSLILAGCFEYTSRSDYPEVILSSPSANAGADFTTRINVPVTLTGTGTDSDGTIISYEWFEDGVSIGNDAVLEYTPTTLGTVTLTFRVRDNDNVIDTDTITITVTDDPFAELVLLDATFVDIDGNAITMEHRYEPGDAIQLQLTVKNEGNTSIPDRDAYIIALLPTTEETISYRQVFMPLSGLAPDENITFITATDTIVNTYDNLSTLTVGLNLNTSTVKDETYADALFPELDFTNNLSQPLTLYTYQSDIAVRDLSVRVMRDTLILRDDNTVDISEDNIIGNAIVYCGTIENSGSHLLNFSFGGNLVFRTELFGDFLQVRQPITLAVGAISEPLCTTIELPDEAPNLTAGTFIFTLDATEYQDSDLTDNTATLTYTITE